MMKAKNTLIALVACLGLVAVPGTAMAQSQTEYRYVWHCEAGTYGQQRCYFRREGVTREWSVENIAYVDRTTILDGITIYDTSVNAQTKVALSAVLVVGALGFLIKAKKFAK
ncbi:MAG: hypothetical protein LBG64_02345 [Pseudomonadales bacterium]|jgi:hypothetical protein|nr:hypothetical protein [Pseudomonadales bacterium]